MRQLLNCVKSSRCRHKSVAIKTWASIQEILEAVEVGLEMGGSPATTSSRFALAVMESMYKKVGK